MREDTSDDDLAELAAAGHRAVSRIFKLKNATFEGGVPALRISVTSPLFARASFPAVISKAQNSHLEVARLFE